MWNDLRCKPSACTIASTPHRACTTTTTTTDGWILGLSYAGCWTEECNAELCPAMLQRRSTEDHGWHDGMAD